jgi:hypothetical protein
VTLLIDVDLDKQIVLWGEMDGIRHTAPINPLDQRRGLTDAEFETTIIQIWLIGAITRYL